jgi:hypothetical protein
MSGYSSCVRCAERLLRDLEADLESPGLTAFEILDLLYMRWLAQRLLHKAKARARHSTSRRDLTPCQDRYGYRRLV